MKAPFTPALLARCAAGAALALSIGALAHAADPVTRVGTRAISESVTVPPGYDTVYFSGTGAGAPAPGAPPMDTEAQALATLEKFKGIMATKGMTLGDIVMMHAYVAVDPKLGKADLVGWNKAYAKYFGTPEQPNKPSRVSIVSTLAGTGLIEIEVIGVTPHK
jgi:enamine deaminase RidA (YjgF/YER057c/UK114 family)